MAGEVSSLYAFKQEAVMQESPSSSILTALGYSVSYEDYRGNFTAARQLADAFLTDARA
jgi:hypothetical protein